MVDIFLRAVMKNLMAPQSENIDEPEFNQDVSSDGSVLEESDAKLLFQDDLKLKAASKEIL